MKNEGPILMTEEFWANSHFSIARHYGQLQINGKHYIIVNKQGITIFELSNPNSKHYVGDDQMAIPPGEPCDLVLMEWVPVYKALGREKTIELVKQNASLEDAYLLIPEELRPKLKTKNKCKKKIK